MDKVVSSQAEMLNKTCPCCDYGHLKVAAGEGEEGRGGSIQASLANSQDGETAAISVTGSDRRSVSPQNLMVALGPRLRFHDREAL